jgi:hypothetical protein
MKHIEIGFLCEKMQLRRTKHNFRDIPAKAKEYNLILNKK